MPRKKEELTMEENKKEVKNKTKIAQAEDIKEKNNDSTNSSKTSKKTPKTLTPEKKSKTKISTKKEELDKPKTKTKKVSNKESEKETAKDEPKTKNKTIKKTKATLKKDEIKEEKLEDIKIEEKPKTKRKKEVTEQQSKNIEAVSKKQANKSKENTKSKKESSTAKEKTASKKETSKEKEKAVSKKEKNNASSNKSDLDKTDSKIKEKEKTNTKEKDKKEGKIKKNTKISKDNSEEKKTKKASAITKKATNKKEKTEVSKQEESVKEETIIQKIKDFIAKIAAMQEETQKEKTEKEKTKRTRKSKGKIENEPVYLSEYYDLPYRYNETIVKILAQTPKRLFVYWDVSDADRNKYIKAFGEDFFDKTYPVLLVHNEDKNYTTEVQINDFANSWYVDIKDAKAKYTIQLGRKFKEVPRNIDVIKLQEENIDLKHDYLAIAHSNQLEVPNDRILFDKLPSKIIIRNVKNYHEQEKTITEISIPNGNKFVLKDFYKEIYKEEIAEGELIIDNPTSGGLSSSSFK